MALWPLALLPPLRVAVLQQHIDLVHCRTSAGSHIAERARVVRPALRSLTRDGVHVACAGKPLPAPWP